MSASWAAACDWVTDVVGTAPRRPPALDVSAVDGEASCCCWRGTKDEVDEMVIAIKITFINSVVDGYLTVY